MMETAEPKGDPGTAGAVLAGVAPPRRDLRVML